MAIMQPWNGPFDITFKDGNRVNMKQVAVQTWKDGKIIREDFYHS